MTDKKKGTGWFRESERHSLASKGIETGRRQKPRTPRVPRAIPAGGSGSNPTETKKPSGNEVLYDEGDEHYGMSFTDDETDKELRLCGEVHDENDHVVGLIFEDESGKRMVRDPTEVMSNPMPDE